MYGISPTVNDKDKMGRPIKVISAKDKAILNQEIKDAVKFT